ncbi:uncharacterized protein N7503_006134 [Penicillium pulvis]|uniref:uncharacterized protein n=1 Tax=Penicillium pulvis TaxID=1562058 RepID=UPI00254695B7|nr:uncharacterized protein N7503_006134 [Penicillium pulvis]KAJ5803684.1 hypothetical protein N7503_006134 [Penicillium pulvis]
MVHTVVANAGTMESSEVLNLEDVDSEGDLRESNEAFKVIDVNLKGTLNTLRLAMHHMKSSSTPDDILPSIILVASTSGYMGGTGVSAYVSSKHGVIGLLRGSQPAAQRYGISVKAIAPFFTPTRMTAGFAERWRNVGLEENTPEMVGSVIAQSALDDTKSGSCILIAGGFLRELEFTRTDMMSKWLGQDLVDFMRKAFQFITSIGGRPVSVNTTTSLDTAGTKAACAFGLVLSTLDLQGPQGH